MVLEREPAPHDKICGEFLPAETQGELTALGLDLGELGGAPISALRLVAGRRAAEARLPRPGLGLSRRRLDAALLEHAERLGAVVTRGVTVRSLAEGRVETDEGGLSAWTILLASGKHEVRGARRAVERTPQGAIGFKCHFRLTEPMRAALEGFVEVVLFEGGYAGLQLVEGGLANLCLVVRADWFQAVGRTWPALIEALQREPHLARRLGDAEQVSPRPLTIADTPYGFIHQPGADPPGLFRLGDQAAVIPSFTGAGMFIALHSARLAAEAIGAGADPAAYYAQLRRDVAAPIRRARWLQRRAETWPGPAAIVSGLALAPFALTRLAQTVRPRPASLTRPA
jgi:flavin-dependent dehydrogenase